MFDKNFDKAQASYDTIEAPEYYDKEYDMLEADAQTCISIDVHCPYCDDYFDLCEIESLMEDGYLLGSVFELEDDKCGFASCKGFNCEVECPNCKKTFIINDIE